MSRQTGSSMLIFVCLLADQSFRSLALAIFGSSARLRQDPCKMHCGMSNVQMKNDTTVKGFTYCQNIMSEETCEKAYLWQAFNANLSGGGIVKPCHWQGDTCDTHKDERDWVRPCPVDPSASCVQAGEGLLSAESHDDSEKTEEADKLVVSSSRREPQSLPKILGTSERSGDDPCKLPCGSYNVQSKNDTAATGYGYCQRIRSAGQCKRAYSWQHTDGGIVKPCHWDGDNCVTYTDERDWIQPCPTEPSALCERLQSVEKDEVVKSEEKDKVAHAVSNQGKEAERVSNARKVHFVEVPLSTGAACLDGSPYVFAVTVGNLSRWTLHMDGRTCNSIESCERVSETNYGSSAIEREDYGTLSGCTCKNFEGYEFADDCTCVDLPMCDGGFFSGYREQPYVTPEGKKIYLRGRVNIQAALDVLFKKYNLASAKELITTGHSVGGTSTILTLDGVAARMPSSTKVRGMPTAGLTIDDTSVCSPGKDSDTCSYNSPHVKDSDTCCYTTFLQQVYKLHNMSSLLSSDCLADHEDRPWTCLLGAHAAAYTKTPMFILNSKHDAWQLVNILGLNHQKIYMTQGGADELWQSVSDYGVSFVKQLKQSLQNTPHVAYITSCVCHAACGLDGSFFSNRFHDYWLGTLVATWFNGYSFEHNILDDEDGPNYRCDASGHVQAVQDAWS